MYGERLALARSIDDVGNITQALADLGFFHVVQGEPDKARPSIEESLTRAHAPAASRAAHHAIAAAAVMAAALGRTEQVARLFGAADRRREAIHSSLRPSDYVGYLSRVESVRAQLGESEFAHLYQEGEQMVLESELDAAIESIH